MDTHFDSNYQFRKLKVIKDWAEQCSRDQCMDIPKSKYSYWNESTKKIVAGKDCGLRNLHPDAQIECGFTSLEDFDAVDHELVLKAIWASIRNGDILKAQTIACERNYYWLAAILKGNADDFYGVNAHRGNVNKNSWIVSCAKYSNAMNQLLGRRNGVDLTKKLSMEILETSIFSALGFNLDVLISSPLLFSWVDKIWAYVKCLHDQEVSRLIQSFLRSRYDQSKLYSGCNSRAFARQGILPLYDFQHLENIDVNWSKLVTIDCEPYSNYESKTAVLIMRLQAAVITGLTSVANYIEDIIIPICEKSLATEFGGVKRIYTHLLLWLLYSNQDAYRKIVPPNSVDIAVSAYINYLIATRKTKLIPIYATFLSSLKRVSIMSYSLASVGIVDTTSPNLSDLSNFDYANCDDLVALFLKYASNEIYSIIRSTIPIVCQNYCNDNSINRTMNWLFRFKDLRELALSVASRFLRKIVLDTIDLDTKVKLQYDVLCVMHDNCADLGGNHDRLATQKSRLRQISFWKIFNSIQKSFQEWQIVALSVNKSFTMIESTKPNFASLASAASKAHTLILQTLLGSNTKENYYIHVWSEFEDALINEMLESLEKGDPQHEVNIEFELGGTDGSIVDVEKQISKYEVDMIDLLKTNQLNSFENLSGSFLDYPVKLEVLKRRTIELCQDRRQYYIVLCRYRDCLCEVLENRQAMYVATFYLCSAYLQIALQTGRGYECFGDLENALLWYEKALHLSNALTNDDPTKSLYCCIERIQLASIMDNFQLATTYLLRVLTDKKI